MGMLLKNKPGAEMLHPACGVSGCQPWIFRYSLGERPYSSLKARKKAV